MSKETMNLTSIGTKEFAQWAWERQLRIEQIFPLATAFDGGEPSEQMRELIEDMTNKELVGLFGVKLKKWLKEMEGDESMAIAEYVNQNDMYGFIVRIATPVRRYNKDESSSYLSWGHVHLKDIYVNDLGPELIDRATTWLDEMEVADKKSSKAKGGAA